MTYPLFMKDLASFHSEIIRVTYSILSRNKEKEIGTKKKLKLMHATLSSSP